MSDKEFQWITRDGDWSNHQELGKVMSVARDRVPRDEKPYSLTKNGKQIRRGPRPWVLKGLERGLKQGRVGDTFRVWAGKEVVFVVREMVAPVHIINTNGNAKADRAWSYGKDKYKDCSFLGAYVCKHIAGSYTMSQHSYGNAVDFGRDTMSELYDLYGFMKSNADELDLEHIIVDDKIWTRGYGESHYSGDRHYHVHVDFTPQYSGSCGVRG